MPIKRDTKERYMPDQVNIKVFLEAFEKGMLFKLQAVFENLNKKSNEVITDKST